MSNDFENCGNGARRVLIGCAAALVAGLAVLSARADGTATAPGVDVPTIPDRSFSIKDFGAVGDGTTSDTAAIQKAIDACSKAGGGIVVVPPGKYLTGPFTLASSLNLHLDKDAVILISDKTDDFKSNGKGYQNCIQADDCHDLEISGDGTIDGQGDSWWKTFNAWKYGPPGATPPLHRPYLIQMRHCLRVLVMDVTLTNSPMFHLVPVACQDVTIKGITITSPATAPNTDGIDPSGINYFITKCKIDTGDDNIALKPVERAVENQPSCVNFLITDCTFLHGHGMSIGGQSDGGLKGLEVRNCTFEDTDFGIRMKASRDHGGVVEDANYDDLKMKNVKTAILITGYYPKPPANVASDAAQPVTARTPIWRHIHITNVTAEGGANAGEIYGLPEMPVSDVVFTNVQLSAKHGMQIFNADGIKFVGSSITAKNGKSLTTTNSQVTGLDAEGGK